MQNRDTESKVFNDPVHGHIKLPPLCVKIIDTPQFQRLRNIKHVGVTYLVYPGAVHNRFEHSLGTCYLAGELIRTIKRNQPDLNIRPRHELCIQVAGLCHDLGHGPFSHLWEDFVKKANPEAKWHHEEASVKMFKHLLKENGLEGNFDEKEIKLIEDLILGNSQNHPGLPKFYFQIVSNGENGIDVDKWDYLARDSLQLNIKTSFDHRRLMEFCRVVTVNKEKHLCYRDKEAENILEMFCIRASLHSKAYQHPVTKVIGLMVVDAFMLADEFVFDGWKVSEIQEDMSKFAKLTDRIFEDILNSEKPELKPAKDLLLRIVKRQLYSLVGKHVVEQGGSEVTDDKLIDDELKQYKNIKKEDLGMITIKLDIGKGNPFQKIYFYKKNDDTDVFIKNINEISHLQTFGDTVEKTYKYLVYKYGKESEEYKDVMKQKSILRLRKPGIKFL